MLISSCEVKNQLCNDKELSSVELPVSCKELRTYTQVANRDPLMAIICLLTAPQEIEVKYEKKG